MMKQIDNTLHLDRSMNTLKVCNYFCHDNILEKRCNWIGLGTGHNSNHKELY